MNFQKQVKKAGIVDRLEAEVEGLRVFEARATMILGIYEALAGPIENSLVSAVGQEISTMKYNSKEQFFQGVVAVAKTILADREYAAAVASLPTEPHTADSEENDAEG
jgi:hypothetical protein